jgi:hypothetical protein
LNADFIKLKGERIMAWFCCTVALAFLPILVAWIFRETKGEVHAWVAVLQRGDVLLIAAALAADAFAKGLFIRAAGTTRAGGLAVLLFSLFILPFASIYYSHVFAGYEKWENSVDVSVKAYDLAQENHEDLASKRDLIVAAARDRSSGRTQMTLSRFRSGFSSWRLSLPLRRFYWNRERSRLSIIGGAYVVLRLNFALWHNLRRPLMCGGNLAKTANLRSSRRERTDHHYEA